MRDITSMIVRHAIDFVVQYVLAQSTKELTCSWWPIWGTLLATSCDEVSELWRGVGRRLLRLTIDDEVILLIITKAFPTCKGTKMGYRSKEKFAISISHACACVSAWRIVFSLKKMCFSLFKNACAFECILNAFGDHCKKENGWPPPPHNKKTKKENKNYKKLIFLTAINLSAKFEIN